MFALEHFVGKYCFLVTALSVHVKSVVLPVETNSNASQFAHLENLIGSVHKYAPEHVYIFVRDMGLSKGQHILLEQYQNVKIISSKNTILERTQFINVEKELVFIDGKYINRKSNGKLLYVDSIRKRYYLAIVIPFIRSQLSNLILQLNLTKIYTPCKNPCNSVDLIFYHNEEQDSSLEMDVRKIEYFNDCYRNIRYLAVKLTGRENQYPLGSFIMWQKLLLDDENNSLSLRTYGYTHFFLMEPDTRPIRQFWLDAIIEQITHGQNQKLYFATNWWISGSIYRGSKLIGQRFLHINGNALYHLSANFIAYIELFSRIYLSRNSSKNGYDLAMFSLLLDNHDLGKRLWHKFRFSDFIQNCWHTGCEGSDQLNNTQFILNNPDTYLIHGGFVEEEPVNNKHTILLLCVILNFIILCQYRRLRRLSRLKRINRYFSFRKDDRKT
jgi:hypothetical protein